jgi:threonine/homoserine/homoserine lactone efflux protein
MIRQSTNKGAAPSWAYVTVNAVIWVIYVTLVLLVPQVLAFSDPVAVTLSVLAGALILRPLRRHASRGAERRFSRR